MRVNSNSQASAVPATSARTVDQQPRLEQDKVALNTTESINTALQQTPEVRSEKVAEARALIQTGSYPPEAIIRKLSALLAISINSRNSSE